MSNYKKILNNTIAMTIGQFSSKVLSFLLLPLYTSFLSTNEYGTYDIIVTTVTLLTPFLTMVISEGVLRFCLDNKYKNTEGFTIGIMVLMGSSTLLLFLAPIFLKFEAIREYYYWFLTFFIVMNLHTVLTQYLKGCGKVKQYSIMGVISTATTLLFNILFLAVFRWGIVGYMSATIISHLSISVIIILKNRLWHEWINPLHIERSIYCDIFKYCIPMIPNSISWWISDSSDKYLLLYFLSSVEVGIYSMAYKIPSMLTIFMSLFISAFQISIFEKFGSKQSYELFENVYRIILSIITVGATILIFSSKYLAYILYQNEFYEAWKVGCILIVAFIFNSLSSVVGTFYTASKNTKYLFYSTVLAAVINISLNIVLIPLFDMYGAAIATLISYMSVWFFRIMKTQKIAKFNLMDGSSIIVFLLIILQVILEIIDSLYIVPVSLGIVFIVFILCVRELRKTDIVEIVQNKLKDKFKIKNSN